MKPSIASLYQAVEIGQDIPPLLIGERSNTNGSKNLLAAAIIPREIGISGEKGEDLDHRTTGFPSLVDQVGITMRLLGNTIMPVFFLFNPI